VGAHPFYGEFGIEAAGFRQSSLCVIHLAFERRSGGQIDARNETAITGVDCLMVFVDSGVEMPEAKFGIAYPNIPKS
jgi:hypothetical protein